MLTRGQPQPDTHRLLDQDLRVQRDTTMMALSYIHVRHITGGEIVK
jgi:hypothetical protein